MDQKEQEKDLFCPDCGLYFKNKRTKKKHLRTKKHMKTSETSFPKKLIPIANADKSYHEKWSKDDDELNFPHPFRCVLAGPPNVGKTTVIKNIIVRQKPYFEKLFVIHCDPDFTKEYEDVNAEMLTEIPNPKDWDANFKTLVIIDDIEYKNLNKDQQSHLDRLLGFASTHKNISVCMTCQNFFNLFPAAKRMANIFCIWKINDTDSFKTIARKCALTQEQFLKIFDTFTEKRDSLWIDLTDGTKYPIRKNAYEIIDKNNL